MTCKFFACRRKVWDAATEVHYEFCLRAEEKEPTDPEKLSIKEWQVDKPTLTRGAVAVSCSARICS